MYKTLFFFLFSILLSHPAYNQTFKAGALLGLTASQINGDESAGYNKPGIEGGLRVQVSLKEKVDLALELQYSQRGAKEDVRVDGTPQSIYKTDYVAVPIIISYKDWLSEDYYKLHFHGGLSYGRLVSAELINDVNNTLFVSTWRKNDLSFLLGATYFINEHFGLTFRYNRSILLLFKSGASATDSSSDPPMEVSFNTPSLAPHNLSFSGLYMF